MFQTREQGKSPETDVIFREISDFPDRVTVMQMCTEVSRTMRIQGAYTSNAYTCIYVSTKRNY